MLLPHMLRALRRQWVVTVLGLLATIAVCVPMAQWFPPEYSVTATVLLLPPEDTETPEQANPLLLLGGLMAPADVLISALGDPAIESQLKENGLEGRPPSPATTARVPRCCSSLSRTRA